MSSPSWHQNESIGSPAVPYEALSGSQLLPAHEHKVAGVANEPPQQYSKAQVFSLLVEAVASFPAERRPHAAAGVGARMRRIDPNFTQLASGFPTFRDVAQAAVDAGYIRVTSPEGSKDISIDLADGITAESSELPDRTIRHLNDEVWRAMLNWHTGKTFVFDRGTKRPLVLSTPPTPADILIPVITREQQLVWMRQFAEAEKEPSICRALLAGLANDDPVRGFSSVMRDEKGVSRRWKEYLKTRVLDRATKWALDEGISFEDLEAASGKGESVTAAPSLKNVSSSEREQILAILAQLPTSELLRLPIPVEYALMR